MRQLLYKAAIKLLEYLRNTILVVCFLLSVILSMAIGMVTDHLKYEQYYEATEALLDSLEEEYNWIDRYDSDALDNYLKAKENL